jgi:hypothetical protein
MKFNWGTAIVLGFILFATFVFTLVAKMIGSGNDLLAAKNYHSAEEINRDLELIAQSAILKKKTSVKYSEGLNSLQIRFPKKAESGLVRLTCLSSDKADFQFGLNLQIDSTGGWIQEEKMPQAVPGNWLAEIRGRVGKDSFLLKDQFRIY